MIPASAKFHNVHITCHYIPFIYGLFTDIVSSSEYTVSKVGLSVNNELKGMCMEEVMAQFKIHLPGESK
jgi:hypothetical protein